MELKSFLGRDETILGVTSRRLVHIRIIVFEPLNVPILYQSERVRASKDREGGAKMLFVSR